MRQQLALFGKKDVAVLEKRRVSNAQINALVRFECYYHVRVKWHEIRDAEDEYQAASEKIQAILAAKAKGLLTLRKKPVNFYEKRREAIRVLNELPF